VPNDNYMPHVGSYCTMTQTVSNCRA